MSNAERYELAETDVAKSLWRKYRHTIEYKSGRRFSINSTHPLVREAEEKGLADVIMSFVRELERPIDIRTTLSDRQENDWIEDWKRMHSLLFRRVYRKTGNLRAKGPTSVLVNQGMRTCTESQPVEPRFTMSFMPSPAISARAYLMSHSKTSMKSVVSWLIFIIILSVLIPFSMVMVGLRALLLINCRLHSASCQS